ncbi:MAG: LPS-assembly protein LptD [Dongiaceae bacterium]
MKKASLMMRRFMLLCALFVMSLETALAASSLYAPIVLEADRIDYNEESGVATASGHVTLQQNGRTLKADKIVYNQSNDSVSAVGNIRLQEEGGETIFADYVELSDEMKNGVIQELKIRLTDDSRLAAREATRKDGTRNEMRNAVFSPCKSCKGESPLWQIKAKKVVHDETTHDIAYRDARIELAGTPVLYTPYLSHPDPTVKRRTGFLSPSLAGSQELGTIIKTPYYWALRPYRDLTLTPMYVSNDGTLLNTEYRERFHNGDLRLQFSGGDLETKRGLVRRDQTSIRGHIDAGLALNLSDEWKFNADIQAASDPTYLRRYRLSQLDEDVLTSRLQGQGFFDRNYANIRALAFQGLRNIDDNRRTPYILPQASYFYVGHENTLGGTINVQTDMLNLVREEGAESRRLVIAGDWERDFTTRGGHIFSLNTGLIATGYHVSDVPSPAGEQDGFTGRALPHIAADWRYPLIRSAAVTTVIEPRVGIVLSPNSSNKETIPNEDSQTFDFDDTNLFSIKRFPGFDKLAGGQRINYGINVGVYDGARGASAFIGQSWRVREDDTYNRGTGAENNFSDVVGRVLINPSRDLDIVYRFRLNTEDTQLRRNELGLTNRRGRVKLGIDYLFIDRLAGSGEFPEREEVALRSAIQIAEFWTLSGRIIKDLGNADATRLARTALTYSDECLTASLGFERDFTDDGENKPSSSIMFRVNLKYLGGESFDEFYQENTRERRRLPY